MNYAHSVGPCHNDVKDVVNAQAPVCSGPSFRTKNKGGEDATIVSTTVKGQSRTLAWGKGLRCK